MGALAAASVLPAFAAVEKIAKVDVTLDLAAIQNEKAAAYWGTLETDLEAAIGLRVTDRLSETGADVLVDIREVELANAFERQLNLADAVLVGQVNIKDDTDNANYNAYELTVSLESAKVVLAEGEVLDLSGSNTEETYQRLVEAFADAVVARLN